MKSIQVDSISLAVSLLVLLLVCCKSAHSSSSSIESLSHRSSNRTTREAESVISTCEKHQVEKTLHFAGCDPIVVTYKICRGHCLSSHYISVGRPSPILDCTCCRASEYTTKLKKLQVMCGGKEKTKKVFIPRVKDCGCVECSDS